MEGSWVGGESPKSFRQRLTKTHGQVRSLANFSSSGREEEGEKKNPLAAKNCCPANKEK